MPGDVERRTAQDAAAVRKMVKQGLAENMDIVVIAHSLLPSNAGCQGNSGRRPQESLRCNCRSCPENRLGPDKKLPSFPVARPGFWLARRLRSRHLRPGRI